RRGKDRGIGLAKTDRGRILRLAGIRRRKNLAFQRRGQGHRDTPGKNIRSAGRKSTRRRLPRLARRRGQSLLPANKNSSLQNRKKARWKMTSVGFRIKGRALYDDACGATRWLLNILYAPGPCVYGRRIIQYWPYTPLEFIR